MRYGRTGPGCQATRSMVLEEAICGRTAGEKMAEVRSVMEKEGTDAFLLSKLDDIMWLFNIRGGDVECNPVALSYAYLTAKECFLFIQETEDDGRAQGACCQVRHRPEKI